MANIKKARPEQSRRVYIKTFGCQMNENDTERMLALLVAEGYQATGQADEADLIVVNSCSVREKSYHKAISSLGRYHKAQRLKPDAKIGLAGCVASQEGGKIRERFPFVDFVIGTDQLHRLPEAVRVVQSKPQGFVASDFQDTHDYHFPITPIIPERFPLAYVTIMKGCDNTCAFCIVPQTRGAEVSRPADEIIAEIKELEQQGIQEVTLLGQNVNSYGRKLCDGISFVHLLRMIARRTRLKRLRFTSPHPKDVSTELIREYRENSILCPHIHLPVQSGASRILKKMRRAHTRETYLRRVEQLRAACPEIAISTDIIVGFPGETEADFHETLSLLNAVRYDSCYAFCYSKRPGTEAAEWADDVPEAVKRRRLQELFDLQNQISLEINQGYVGRAVEVLVEGPAKLGKHQFTGRSPENKIVNFDGRAEDRGAILKVQVERASAYALYDKR